MGAFTVYPSENDIAVVTDEGRVGQEITHKEYVRVAVEGHFISGFTLPATTSATLVIDVATGEAYIGGQRVQMGSIESPTMAANNTNHLFLQLTFDGNNLVDGVQIVSNTTGSVPSDSIKIGRAITDGTEVTSTLDDRLLDPNKQASAQGNSLNNFIANKAQSSAGIALGAAPAVVTGVTATMAIGFFQGRAAAHVRVMVTGFTTQGATAAEHTIGIYLNGVLQIESKLENVTTNKTPFALQIVFGSAPFAVLDRDIANTIDVRADEAGGVAGTITNTIMHIEEISNAGALV